MALVEAIPLQGDGVRSGGRVMRALILITLLILAGCESDFDKCFKIIYEAHMESVDRLGYSRAAHEAQAKYRAAADCAGAK